MASCSPTCHTGSRIPHLHAPSLCPESSSPTLPTVICLPTEGQATAGSPQPQPPALQQYPAHGAEAGRTPVGGTDDSMIMPNTLMLLTSALVTSGHQERDVCRASGSWEGPRPVSPHLCERSVPIPSLQTRRGRALRAVSCQTNASQESERPSAHALPPRPPRAIRLGKASTSLPPLYS